MALSTTYSTAEAHRAALDAHLSSSTATYQETLTSAINTYIKCTQIASQIALFSPNESLEDITSHDLQYLLLHYHIGELRLRLTGNDRRGTLQGARTSLNTFLTTLDSYDILQTSDLKVYERYNDSPDTFTIAATNDPANKRNVKIERFRAEKALKAKIQMLQRDQRRLEERDDLLRELHLAEIHMAVQKTFEMLEGIALEMQMLAMAPINDPTTIAQVDGNTATDDRHRSRQADTYSERLDPSLSSLMNNSNTGPLLSSSGRPLRPFTLLDARQRVQDGVFRSGHNLPSMSIDEYLEEERKRGGIIEGGGEESGRREVVDEDDMEAADRETVKKREWDEFVEENPRGSGNTLNRG